MKNFLVYLGKRLREPSTIIALSGLGVLVGLPPGVVDLVGSCVAGGALVVAAALPDPAAQ